MEDWRLRMMTKSLLNSDPCTYRYGDPYQGAPWCFYRTSSSESLGLEPLHDFAFPIAPLQGDMAASGDSNLEPGRFR